MSSRSSNEKPEALAAALGRIAAEEMDVAVRELGRRDRGEAVHESRKAIKRLRGLLRSLRVSLPEKLFRAENRRLAEAGRKMSPLRDIHVQLRTLGKIKADGSPMAARVRRELLSRQQSFTRSIPSLHKAVREMLGRSRQTIGSWPLHKTTTATLVAGLKRMYKQGRAAFRTAHKNSTPENLHEWRKKTKALGYGFELVEQLKPGELARSRKRCQKLGDELGSEHDLFMVLEALRASHKASPAPDFSRLARGIKARRAKLQKRAFKIGKSIFQEKPRAFARRLDCHLEGAVKQQSRKK